MDDPTNDREIATTAVRPGGADISPDGRSIAFTAFDAQNQPAMSVCDLDTCSARKTLSSAGTEMHWMPDGKALAYVDPRTQSDLWAVARARIASDIVLLRGLRKNSTPHAAYLSLKN